ncbi:hypothetical protein BDZ97DRAFT_1757225 [Flammula alnicola]|nr:hypothetical protein BDZ97DRAFT_1757225 [Flammula alnicola]
MVTVLLPTSLVCTLFDNSSTYLKQPQGRISLANPVPVSLQSLADTHFRSLEDKTGSLGNRIDILWLLSVSGMSGTAEISEILELTPKRRKLQSNLVLPYSRDSQIYSYFQVRPGFLVLTGPSRQVTTYIQRLVGGATT